MSDKTETENEEPTPAAAVVRKRRGISIVWVIPILAALVAGGLWLQAIRARGPLVTVVFDNGEGLEAGKTMVMFQGVTVGTVESVDLSEKLDTVVTQIRLTASAKKMAQEGAEYWVVRPTFGIGGLSGLETLVSGPYIGVIPGDGAKKTEFNGVTEPPMGATRIPGLKVRLDADGLGSLTIGSPVAYRKIQVGEVTGYAYSNDRTKVDLTVTIYDTHRDLVREGSRFWNASGIKVSLGAGGLKIKSQSLAALLLGGISFTNPGETKSTPPAKPGAKFKLYTSEHDLRREGRIREGLNILMESTNLGSLRKGDPVLYREVQVGEVLHTRLAPDSRNVYLEVLVWKDYAPLVRTNSRFWNASGIRAHFGLFSGLDVSVESLESLVAGGISFATPDAPGKRAASGSVFSLAEKPDDDWLGWAPRILNAVGGAVRAPVKRVKEAIEGSKKDEAKDAAPPEPETAKEDASATTKPKQKREGPRHHGPRSVGRGLRR